MVPARPYQASAARTATRTTPAHVGPSWSEARSPARITAVSAVAGSMAGLPGVGPSLRQPSASGLGQPCEILGGSGQLDPTGLVGKRIQQRVEHPGPGRRIDLARNDDRHAGLDEHRGERTQLGVDRRVAEEQFEREWDGHRHGTAAYGRLRRSVKPAYGAAVAGSKRQIGRAPEVLPGARAVEVEDPHRSVRLTDSMHAGLERDVGDLLARRLVEHAHRLGPAVGDPHAPSTTAR